MTSDFVNPYIRDRVSHILDVKVALEQIIKSRREEEQRISSELQILCDNATDKMAFHRIFLPLEPLESLLDWWKGMRDLSPEESIVCEIQTKTMVQDGPRQISVVRTTPGKEANIRFKCVHPSWLSFIEPRDFKNNKLVDFKTEYESKERKLVLTLPASSLEQLGEVSLFFSGRQLSQTCFVTPSRPALVLKLKQRDLIPAGMLWNNTQIKLDIKTAVCGIYTSGFMLERKSSSRRWTKTHHETGTFILPVLEGKGYYKHSIYGSDVSWMSGTLKERVSLFSIGYPGEFLFLLPADHFLFVRRLGAGAKAEIWSRTGEKLHSMRVAGSDIFRLCGSYLCTFSGKLSDQLSARLSRLEVDMDTLVVHVYDIQKEVLYSRFEVSLRSEYQCHSIAAFQNRIAVFDGDETVIYDLQGMVLSRTWFSEKVQSSTKLLGYDLSGKFLCYFVSSPTKKIIALREAVIACNDQSRKAE